METVFKGYLYLALAALLLLIAMPVIIQFIVISVAIAFLASGALLLKKVLYPR